MPRRRDRPRRRDQWSGHRGPRRLARCNHDTSTDRATSTADTSVSASRRAARRHRAPAMAGATEARIAHLLDEDLPIRRPPAGLVALSLLGAIGAIWLVMCLGQGLLAMIGI